eukprot:COSAG05_NODE_2050_length_3639_cov_2.035876_3_plen_118_part_00
MVQYMIVEIKKSLSFWTSYRPHVYDILAISVEDNVQYCQDANELAIIKEEGCTGGGHSGGRSTRLPMPSDLTFHRFLFWPTRACNQHVPCSSLALYSVCLSSDGVCVHAYILYINNI